MQHSQEGAAQSPDNLRGLGLDNQLVEDKLMCLELGMPTEDKLLGPGPGIPVEEGSVSPLYHYSSAFCLEG